MNVNRYSIYSGACDEFAGNSRSDIAGNYGDSCHGARLPDSSFSSLQATGNVNWSYGNGSRLRLGGAFSQAQGKNFAYGVILNPGVAANLQTGFRAQNAVWTLNWTQNLAIDRARARTRRERLLPDRPVRPESLRQRRARCGDTWVLFLADPAAIRVRPARCAIYDRRRDVHQARLLHPQHPELLWRHSPRQRRLRQRASAAVPVPGQPVRPPDLAVPRWRPE